MEWCWKENNVVECDLNVDKVAIKHIWVCMQCLQKYVFQLCACIKNGSIEKSIHLTMWCINPHMMLIGQDSLSENVSTDCAATDSMRVFVFWHIPRQNKIKAYEANDPMIIIQWSWNTVMHQETKILVSTPDTWASIHEEEKLYGQIFKPRCYKACVTGICTALLPMCLSNVRAIYAL